MSEAPGSPLRHHRSLHWRSARYAALDFETTGLDLGRDAVVSFGVVPIDRGRIVLSDHRYEEVVPTVSSSPASVRVHGLRDQDLRHRPPIDAVMPILSAALSGRFLLAWSAGVELGFLVNLYGRTFRTWRRRTIDVLELARSVERSETSEEPRTYVLSSVAARFGVPAEDPHHALGDALMTAELFLIIAARMAEDGSLTVGQLLRAGRAR